MKLVTHLHNGNENLALLINNKLYNVSDADVLLPATMQALLEHWEENIEKLQTLEKKIIKGQLLEHHFTYFQEASIMAPVPKPTSCRDGYAFRQHVASARRNRKVDMIAEFDQYPIFYFTNHNAIQGPGNIVCMPDHYQKVDFELEVAIVVCKKGTDTPADSEAENDTDTNATE